MLKPYKMTTYHITDPEKVYEQTRTKMDGESTWRFLKVIEWHDGMWNPIEVDVEYFLENAREVVWLEILVVTGQSEKQSLWEHRACFGVPELDEDL